jgi:acetyl esterase/lipase
MPHPATAILALACLILPLRVSAQTAPVYRVIDGDSLLAHVFLPPEREAGAKADAILLFHGGGWSVGEPAWTFAAARRSRGCGRAAMNSD